MTIEYLTAKHATKPPEYEHVKRYNEDVQCVTDRIKEYLGDEFNKDDLECCAAAVVDQLFRRWFEQDYYV